MKEFIDPCIVKMIYETIGAQGPSRSKNCWRWFCQFTVQWYHCWVPALPRNLGLASITEQFRKRHRDLGLMMTSASHNSSAPTPQRALVELLTCHWSITTYSGVFGHPLRTHESFQVLNTNMTNAEKLFNRPSAMHEYVRERGAAHPALTEVEKLYDPLCSKEQHCRPSILLTKTGFPA